MKLREVWEAAKLDGLAIPYPQFRVYVSRLRRRRQRPSISAPRPPRAVANGEPTPPTSRRQIHLATCGSSAREGSSSDPSTTRFRLTKPDRLRRFFSLRRQASGQSIRPSRIASAIPL